jgi:hypothetical protein
MSKETQEMMAREVKTFNDRIAANQDELVDNWPTKRCEKCAATGWRTQDHDRCYTCSGTGVVANRDMTPDEVKVWWAENGEHLYLGATRCYPQDRYPLLVTSVSKSGKTITYVAVESVSGLTGHEPARFDGDWPVWDHEYTQQDLRLRSDIRPEVPRDGAATDRTARWSEKRGCYQDGGTPIKVGTARLYRNYSY